MSQELNAREVLYHLNDLGYTNINALQLKDFMIDLKKLMKHNDRCHGQGDSDSALAPCFTQRDVFADLYHTDTIASRAKLNGPKKKESTITVQINRAKSAAACKVPELQTGQRKCFDGGIDVVDSSRTRKSDGSRKSDVHCDGSRKSDVHCDGSRKSDVVHCDGTRKSVDMDGCCKTRDHSPSPRVSAAIPPKGPSCSCVSTACSSGAIQLEKKPHMQQRKCRPRPKSAFIRPRLNTKPPKSDPVALYHQYQEQWKKHKIPGTTNHLDLRWHIREKLIGDKYDYCF